MSLFDLSAVSSFLKIIQYHHIAAGTSHRLHHVEARFLDSARTFIIAALAALGHSLELHTVANDHAASTHDDVCITWYFGFDSEPNAIGERVLVELAAAGDGGISFERLARDIVRACADVMCTTHPALTAHWRSISVDMMSVSGEDGMEGYEMCPMAAVNKIYVPSVNRFLPAHVALWKTWREQRDERTMYAEWFLEFLIWLPHEFLHCVDSAFRTDADFACSCTPLQRDWSFEHCACFAQFYLMYSMAAHMPTIQLGDDGGNLAMISLPAHVFFEAHLLLLRGTRLHTAFDNADQCSGSGDVVADASLSATIAKSNDTCATPESELTAVLADTRALRSRLALWCGDESVLPFNALTPNEVFSELGVHFYDFSLSICALDSAELRFAHRSAARGECQTQPLEFADVFRAFYSMFPAFHCTAESAHVSNMNFSARAPLLVSPVSQSSTAAAARTDVSGDLSPTYVFGAWPPRALLKLWRPLASTVWLPSSLVLGKYPSDPIPASCDAECSVACELMDGSCA